MPSTIMLAVYVDGIMLTGSDIGGIKKSKEYLIQQFVTKDMRNLNIFF